MSAKIETLTIVPKNVHIKYVETFKRIRPQNADIMALGKTGMALTENNDNSLLDLCENFFFADSISFQVIPNHFPHFSINGLPKKYAKPYTSREPSEIPKAAAITILNIRALTKATPLSPVRNKKPEVSITRAEGIGAMTSSIIEAEKTPMAPRGMTLS